MTAPAVSIVIPCYNGGRFLDQALQSLQQQTFTDFEVIIVDDGSNDPATVAKLASLKNDVGQKRLSVLDIKIVSQPNAGLAAARNTGFQAARADFVLPLDCDDALSVDFLAETVPLLKAADADVAFIFTHMLATGALSATLPRHFNRFDQLFLNRLPYCLLLRKWAWEKVGGYDAAMRDGYEDWEFNIRLTLAGFRGIEISRPLFIYYVSADGMLMSRSARAHGLLWREIMRRHEDVYNWPTLQLISRAAADPLRRIPLFVGLLLVWSGKLLPAGLISAVFFSSLRFVHWFRVRNGSLTIPGATASS